MMCFWYEHTNRIKEHVSSEPCMLAVNVSQTMAGSGCDEKDREE
jgi:hypothetical protein